MLYTIVKVIKKEMNKKAILKAYIGLLGEQNVDSPHVCLQGERRKYGCVVDAGASEGIFSLNVIDYCDKLYLIECDDS